MKYDNVAEAFSLIKSTRIIPVVTIDDASDAVPLARALTAGNINAAEITFRTDAAGKAILNIHNELPDFFVGAGTVSSKEQARAAISSGAKFIVSAGFSRKVVSYCQKKRTAVIPGVATPTEIQEASSMGLEVLKLFPCEILGGLKYLDTLKGPFPKIKFVVTGGITAANAKDFLLKENVFAAAGTWITSRDKIKNHDWEQIKKAAAEAAAL